MLEMTEVPEGSGRPPATPGAARAAVIIVALVVAAILGLSIWYLVQPQPLLVQGEADARRIDIAARVDGRVETRPAARGADVAAGDVLVTIDNPELRRQLDTARAAAAVSEADLARILAGTRPEIIAQKRAAVAAAEAEATLQRKEYERTRTLTARDVASVQRLDQATASLDVAERQLAGARLALEAAEAGYTPEERGVARATLAKATAAIATLEAQEAELSVDAPTAGQVYQLGVEVGEYVSPGVPLLSLVDLSDVWLRFDMREDLLADLKVGDRLMVKVPALGDRQVEVEVREIATRGEYAGWRATRATGDFDLRTFEVRAYPPAPVPGLRPGMSAYLDMAQR